MRQTKLVYPQYFLCVENEGGALVSAANGNEAASINGLVIHD